MLIYIPNYIGILLHVLVYVLHLWKDIQDQKYDRYVGTTCWARMFN
jgi:hypothetical protein